MESETTRCLKRRSAGIGWLWLREEEEEEEEKESLCAIPFLISVSTFLWRTVRKLDLIIHDSSGLWTACWIGGWCASSGNKYARHYAIPIRDLPFYICTQKREKYFHPFLCTVYRWMAKEKEGVGRNRRFWLGTNSGGSKRSLYDCGIVKGSREPVLVLVVRRLWSDAPFHPDDWWSHPAIHKRISLSLTIALVEWIAPSSSFPLDWFPVFGHLVSLAHPTRTYIHIYISFILFRWMIDQCRRQIMLRQKEIGERNRQVGQQGALARSLSCTWYVFFNFDQNRIKNGMKWFRQSG